VKKLIVSPDSKPCHVKVPHHFDFGVLAPKAEVALMSKAPLMYFFEFLLPDEADELIKAIDEVAAAERNGANGSVLLKKRSIP